MKSCFANALLLTALVFAQRSAAADETCVPKADGGWHCGEHVTASDGAPLPRAERTSRPPLLLIDPARFGEGGVYRADDAPATAKSEPIKADTETVAESASEMAPENASTPSAKPMPATIEAAVEASPVIAAETPAAAAIESKPAQVEAPLGEVVTIPEIEPGTRVATLADASPGSASTGTGFTVQLAIASSTKGFEKLRGELKLSRSSTRELPLKNGSFALLMGVFPSIEAARAAIPKAAKGAFARDIRALENL
jgi:hypothetical protein